MHDVEPYDDWQYQAPTVHTAKFKRKLSETEARVRARRQNRRWLILLYTLAVGVGYLLFLAWVNS